MEQFQNLIVLEFKEMMQGIKMINIFSLAKQKNFNGIQAVGTTLKGQKRSIDESYIDAFSESDSMEEIKKMKTEKIGFILFDK